MPWLRGCELEMLASQLTPTASSPEPSCLLGTFSIYDPFISVFPLNFIKVTGMALNRAHKKHLSLCNLWNIHEKRAYHCESVELATLLFSPLK